MLKQSRVLAVTAAALAVSFGAVHIAGAQTPDAPPGGPGMMMGGPGGQGGPGGHRMEMRMKQQMDQLHAQLKLTADQEKLWQSALDTMKQNHEAMRASHKQMHDQMKSMENQPILDLNALNAAHQKIEQQNAQLRDQTTAAWLNFYNALNDQQKTTVSSALKQHFARMHEHEMKMHQRWSKNHGANGASAPAAQ